MKADIVSIGTELLMGQIVDTNAAWLAAQLPMLGIDLYFISQVGDNLGRVVDTLDRARKRSDLVITTGGLGPTEDDLTREAIAQLLGEEIRVDPALEAHLLEFFKNRGIAMAQRNIKQATLIPSAKALPNPRGTAPGWWVEKGGAIIVAMPGPPREAQRMWEYEVVPRLKGLLKGEAIISRLLKTFGIPEATLDEMLGESLHSNNPSIGVYSKTNGIHLRLTAKAASEAEAWKLLTPLEARVKEIVGSSLWGADDDTLEGVAGELLVQKKMTLATMESITGGLLASTIADNPSATGYFKGGIVAYSVATMVEKGVPAELIQRYGVNSQPVAQAMAQAARESLHAHVGIGITGITGPALQETPPPPGAVHYAMDHPRLRRAFGANYPQGRQFLKERAVSAALFELQKFLQELDKI